MLRKIESGQPGVLTRLDPPEENLGLSGWMRRFKQRQEMVGVAVYLSALKESVQTELDIVLANNLMKG